MSFVLLVILQRWLWNSTFAVRYTAVNHVSNRGQPYFGVYSLVPSDAIWRWRFWSTLAQVMACCLTPPSHYLNQCWLIISKAPWHSSEEDITVRLFEDTDRKSKIEKYMFKITLGSPRGQWVHRKVGTVGDCKCNVGRPISKESMYG